MTDPQPWLALLDAALLPVWTAWGAPFTRLEAVACALSLWMVALNLRVNVWAWPLAIASSVLYGALFARSGLYGEAALQGFFVAMAGWGWWRWACLRSAPQDDPATGVNWLSPRQRWQALGVTALIWPLLAWLLQRFTDSEVAWADALPTAGSLVGQYLLAKKRVENWVWWLAVNVVSVALFAWKSLWLTVGLYALFALLSWWGLQAWRARAAPTAQGAAALAGVPQ